jgi:hypothetical protein
VIDLWILIGFLGFLIIGSLPTLPLLAAAIVAQWAEKFLHSFRGTRSDGDLKLDCSPDVIITLVHGTWSQAADWTFPSSVLCQALSATLAPRSVGFCRHRWSGRNSMRARTIGARELTSQLQELLVSKPNARHFIIGHSHGGTISLDALNPAIVEKMRGLVCLSTPVLIPRIRTLDPLTETCFRITIFILCMILALVLVVQFGLINSQARYVFWVVGMVTGAVISGSPAFYGTSWTGSRDYSFIDRSKVLFLRTAGDEASAVLGAAHLLSWAFGKLLSLPALLLWAAHIRIQSWQRYVIINWLKFTVVFLTLLIAWMLTSWLRDKGLDVAAAAKVIPILLNTILVLMAVLFFYGTPHSILATWTVTIIIFFLLSPLFILLSLLALVIGPEIGPAALYMEVAAEVTPPGEWNVALVVPERRDLAKGAGKLPAPFQLLVTKGRPTDVRLQEFALSLEHSLAYQSPEAIERICRWIVERASSR